MDSATPTNGEQGQSRGVCQGRKAAAKVGPVRKESEKGVPALGSQRQAEAREAFPSPSPEPRMGTLRTQESQSSFY